MEIIEPHNLKVIEGVRVVMLPSGPYFCALDLSRSLLAGDGEALRMSALDGDAGQVQYVRVVPKGRALAFLSEARARKFLEKVTHLHHRSSRRALGATRATVRQHMAPKLRKNLLSGAGAAWVEWDDQRKTHPQPVQQTLVFTPVKPSAPAERGPIIHPTTVVKLPESAVSLDPVAVNPEDKVVEVTRLPEVDFSAFSFPPPTSIFPGYTQRPAPRTFVRRLLERLGIVAMPELPRPPERMIAGEFCDKWAIPLVAKTAIARNAMVVMREREIGLERDPRLNCNTYPEQVLLEGYRRFYGRHFEAKKAA